MENTKQADWQAHDNAIAEAKKANRPYSGRYSRHTYFNEALGKEANNGDL